MATTTVRDEARIIPGLNVELRGVETVNGFDFLHGRAVPYNTPANIGWYIEEHAPGSLAASIKDADSARGLPLLLFHNDQSWPIGVNDTWEDGDEALDGVWKLDKSEEAQRAAQLANDGMLGYMSIRFQPLRSEWEYADDWNPNLGEAHMDRCRRVKSRLVEVSLVSTPAYKEAAVKWVRSSERAVNSEAAGSRHLDAWQKQLDALKNGRP